MAKRQHQDTSWQQNITNAGVFQRMHIMKNAEIASIFFL